MLSLPDREIRNATEPLVVKVSGELAPTTPYPRLKPAVAGKWIVAGDEEIFKSASTLAPCSSYRLTVPSATAAEGKAPLGKHRYVNLHVSCPPLRGLQQALARLGYLPDSLHVASGTSAYRGTMDMRKAAHLLYAPPAGKLLSNIAGAPPLRYGSFDGMTKGAVMVFEEDHKLQPDGEPGPQMWSKLLKAVAHKFRSPRPYTFVTVTEGSPETLEVHRGSHVVLSSPANTGVSGAQTEQGVFPIFARFLSTRMVGTDPDGTKYDVPDVPWVNYFNGGDAVHGYERPGYGYPQSNGCVELPVATAQRVFAMLRLGDIVDVT